MSDNQENILHRPAAHTLPELFRELRFGRPAEEQRLLTWLAAKIERGDDLKPCDDPADWWKRD